MHKEKEMADFRKLFLVLVAVTLMASVASAAGINCSTSGSVPLIVRAESTAELVGDVVLTCTGGTLGDPAFPINFQLTFGATQVTSRLITGGGGTTEALMVIDETTPSVAVPSAGLWVPGTPVPVNTVYRGVIAAQGYGLQWNGIPFVPPGSGTRTLRFTNIRVNASALGASFIPVPITAQISVSGASTVTLSQTSLTVGSAQKSYTFAVGAGASALQCQPQATSAGYQFTVSFTELFGSAFKQKIAPNQDASGLVPSTSFQSESGYVNQASLGTETGIASNGTRFLVTFTNIQAGVVITVSNMQLPSSTGSIAAQYVNAAADGSGGGVTAFGTTVGTAGVGIGVNNANVLAAVAGNVWATWEVTAANQSVNETAVFGVNYSYPSNTTANIPGLGSSGVTGNLAPAYASPTGTTALLGTAVGGAIPRFVLNPAAGNSFTINPCVTDLLFPFVASDKTYDTGIVIANTSKDPFNTGQQSGTCTLWYYGAGPNGEAAPNSQTSTTITPGSILAVSLQNGGSNGITGVGFFYGYVIAQCRFQYAHGFANISDPGLKLWASGYQALVLDGGAAIGRTVGTSANGNPGVTTRETLTN
jgi:hypothetical protein